MPTKIPTVVLLVICALLAALIFPAVQSAREAARRQQCGNNTKQLCLGLQYYHETFLYLPYGARNRTLPPDYDQPSWGSSWLLATIPFCGINRGYDAIIGAEYADPANDYVSSSVRQTGGNLTGWMKYTTLCPSSPLPEMQTLNGIELIVPSYAGIMGATDEPGDYMTGFVDDFERTVPGPYQGWASRNGMLVINDSLTFAACTDGTANMIIVGEVSDWYYSDDGQRQNTALSIGDASRNEAGWLAGTNLPQWTPSEKPNYAGAENWVKERARINQTAPPVPVDRVCNLISIHHSIGPNNRLGTQDNAPNWGTEGIGRCGLNNPLLSAHPAGAMVGYLDGHVELLSKQMSRGVLKKLACRDENGPRPDF
jgi:prepilin-type processing-associated H-X9-DG protein